MPKMPANSSLRLRIQIILALMLSFPGVAAATSPCRNDTFAKAKIVVEARVTSFWIGASGLMISQDFPDRMIRVDLEIKRVIKGTFTGKKATLYGFPYPPPDRFWELSTMALIGGLGGPDTFEWELSANKIGDDISFYSLNNCNYSKFPTDASRRPQP
ncbi:hypothetical protein [Rhizobium sp. CNPSo 3490]|uniref:hypothetical protein n=1 Tax=Rhizobium sp. CNPSo 3490 TaxID=3021407 RepID=UPI00254D37BF|nr:hypothetical protein [Rhizobium sp. CNPSo 3490]MDK4733010.1 hypothetical protein [Rhizobium sp. CNPSo 3490]